MKEPICPLIKDECLGHGCTFWTHISGKHPQTGADIDTFDCSVKWMPMLMIEQSRWVRGVQAAVESTRNEITARQDQLNNAVALGQRETAKRIGEDQCQTERLLKAT